MRQRLPSFVCVIPLMLLAVSSTATDKQPFSLTIAAPKEPVKTGAELRLLVTVTNTSSGTVSFGTSLGLVPEDWPFYKIDVRDEHGHPAPPSAYVRTRDKRIPWFKGSVAARTLKPGESFVDEVTATQYYDLSQPGTYTIWVARPVPPGIVPPGQKLGKDFVQSNTITVTVVK